MKNDFIYKIFSFRLTASRKMHNSNRNFNSSYILPSGSSYKLYTKQSLSLALTATIYLRLQCPAQLVEEILRDDLENQP